MSLFNMFRGHDINSGLEKYRNDERAVLIDVRTEEEFRGGHIPGAVNIPVDRIDEITAKLKDKSRPVFTYCHSGARSTQAVIRIKNLGYSDVTNLGGIIRYRGELE